MKFHGYNINCGEMADGTFVAVIGDQILGFDDISGFDEFWTAVWKQRRSYIKSDSLLDGPPPASVAGEMIDFLDDRFKRDLADGEEPDLLGTFVGGAVCGTSLFEDMPQELEGPHSLNSAVREFIDSTEWDVEWSSDAFRTGIRGDNGTWHVRGMSSESDETFVFLSSRILRAPEDKFGAVIEYINMINNRVHYGNFELDVSDGEIRFRTSIDVEGDRLTKPLVRQIVSGNLSQMDYYLPGFDWLIYGGFAPDEAFEAIQSHSWGEQHPMSMASVNLVNQYLAKSGSSLEVCFGGSGKLKVQNLPDEILYNPFPGKTDGRMYLSYIKHAEPESIDDVLTEENIGSYSIGEIMEGILWLHSRRLATSEA